MKYPLSILTFLSVILFSCMNKNGHQELKGTEISDQQVEIRWLAQWYGEGKKETLIHEIARDFLFLNQGYDIDLEFPYEMAGIDPSVSSYFPMRDTIVKMVKENKWPYDIMLCDIYLYKEVSRVLGNTEWASKYFVDFKDEKWFQENHKEAIYKTDKYTSQYGGIAPGAYIEAIWDLLFVSAKTEKLLGLDVKNIDMTLDDFISYAQKTHQYNQNQNNNKITFFWDQRGGEGFNRLFEQLVMSVLQKDSANNREEAFAALSEVYNALEKSSRYSPLTQHTLAENEMDLQPDKFLLTYHSSWVTLLWKNNFPEEVKQMHLCEFPSMKGKKAPSFPGNYNPIFVIPKAAKNKEAAIKLMKFISSTETGEKWMKYAKSQTGLKTNIEYGDFAKDEFSLFSQHLSKKYNNILKSTNLSQALFQSDKTVVFNASQVMRGNMDAEAAIELVKKQLE